MAARLPPDLSSFIAEHAISVDEVEVIGAMTDAPERWWDARLIGGVLGIPVSTARGLLDHLARLNLFDIRFTNEIRYQFHPGTHELAVVVALLVATYRADRDTIVRAIATPATRGVRDFADAFRFRKHGDR